MLRFLLILALLAPTAFAAPPAEERLRDVIKRTAPIDQDFLAKAAYAGEYQLSSLVDFCNRQGRLIASFHLPASLAKQLKGTEPLVIGIEGSPHAWCIYRRKAGTLDEKLSLITLVCYAPDIQWPFNRFMLASDGTGVMVSGAQTFGQLAYQPFVSLNQGERQIHLAWRVEQDKFIAKRMDVAEASQLASRIPNLYEMYLMRVFRQLGPGLAASDVYRVFEQIPADPKVARKVIPLVESLASSEASDRDGALAALRAMGRPAVLATLRIPVSELSPEQAERLASFHASDGWCRIPDIEAARHDELFLTACLQDEDSAVRAAAESSLAALRATRGLPIN